MGGSDQLLWHSYAHGASEGVKRWESVILIDFGGLQGRDSGCRARGAPKTALARLRAEVMQQGTGYRRESKFV